MMEMLYELRSTSGLCRLFDFFQEAHDTMQDLIASGTYSADELFINRVVTE